MKRKSGFYLLDRIFLAFIVLFILLLTLFCSFIPFALDQGRYLFGPVLCFYHYLGAVFRIPLDLTSLVRRVIKFYGSFPTAIFSKGSLISGSISTMNHTLPLKSFRRLLIRRN